MSAPSKPRIGITPGDPNGVGPEVTMKVLSDHRLFALFTPVLYCSARALSYYKKELALSDFNYQTVKSSGQYVPKVVNVVNAWDENLDIQPGKASTTSGKAAFDALKQACEDLKAGVIDALVTGPIDKHTIHSEAFPFKGHTEYLTDFFGADQSLMLMSGDDLKVGLVTEHVPLGDVPALITAERVAAKLQLLERSLQKDFGIAKPRIAVLGLNPHAGDGGLLGNEEESILRPVVQDLRNKGKLVTGPFPADGFFAAGSTRKVDGVLAMYHDQGLIPFKVMNFQSGVNYTAGLPVVRTSPDHGTAYALAGKNQADESSMRHAMYLVCDILRQRNEPSKEK